MESQDEYYMLESHYDNPESSGGITITFGVEAVYTPRLRCHRIRIILIGYANCPKIVVLIYVVLTYITGRKKVAH